MHSRVTTAALSALVHSILASATKYCPNNGAVCYQIAVPQSSASSGSGNIYMQLEAPTTYSWIALGAGDSMTGSNIFVMYEDGKGNVTISPRLGKGHTMPTQDTSSTAAKLTLLAGSGVDGSTMRANVMCSNCQSWSGGTMSLSDTSSSWIAAWKGGSSLATTNGNAQISRHDAHDSFGLNLQQAQVSTDSNPFVGTSGDGGSGTGSGSGSGSGSSTGSGTGSAGVIVNTGAQDGMRLVSAHGVIMAITFVILYPIGSILMPLLGNWIVHAAFQFVTFILMWAGFAIGIVVGRNMGYNFNVTHTTFGTVIVSLMGIQPILGWLHHAHYMKHHSRGPVSYAHIAYGRSLMLLGVVNGGLGLQLAEAPNNLVIAYAVVVGATGLAYAVIKLTTSFRKHKAARRAGGPGSAKIPGSNSRDKYGPGGDVEMSRRF